jgi:hemolysin activation/secretion protein
VRVPILRIPEWDLLVQATPFIDYGLGWNFSGNNPEPGNLGGAGIGLRFQVGDSVTARLEYGIPWVDVNSTDRTLQEQGLYFSIMFNPF